MVQILYTRDAEQIFLSESSIYFKEDCLQATAIAQDCASSSETNTAFSILSEEALHFPVDPADEHADNDWSFLI